MPTCWRRHQELSLVIHPSSLPLWPTNSTLFVDVLTLALINIAMENQLLVSRASHQIFFSEVKPVFSPLFSHSDTTSLGAANAMPWQLQDINIQCQAINATLTSSHQPPALSINTSTSPQLKPLDFKTPSTINLPMQAENILQCCLDLTRQHVQEPSNRLDDGQ